MGNSPDLGVNLGRIKLRNPVLVASGTFGYGEEYSELIDLNKLGGVITKSITLQPEEGNSPPRLAETPAGLLNAIGLANPGLRAFCERSIPFLEQFDTRIVVSIAGEREDDYLRLSERLNHIKRIDGLEINISCPNIKGGLSFSQDPNKIFSLLKKLKRASEIPLIVKITPEAVSPVEIAQASKEGGAEAISLINTLIGMAIDVEEQKPLLANITGGLSGPAIKPVALRWVWEVSQNVDLPIIGMGGIMNPEDALEFVLAGAEAIAIGTANFVDPWTPLKVIEGIRKYLVRKNIKKFKDLVGKLHNRFSES
ncbi:dihydroorotate dehydrogenase [Candidatus Aerophobetes bacterium]|nr:dihydroorotate dehydrogenase [Candidatus Aerophobetes bacterium]